MIGSSHQFENDRTAIKNKIVRDLHVMMDDADELFKLTAAQADQRIADARSRVQASLARTRAHIDHMQGDVSDAMRSMVSATENGVRENPWAWLGAAAAAGFVVGMLVAR